MPRGFKRDLAVTKLLQSNHLLRNKRSFVSLPDTGGKVHLKLFGEDLEGARLWIFHDSKSKCAKCGCAITWDDFELDHIVGGLSGRGDEVENLQALCRPDHRMKHPQVRFSKRVPRA